MIPFLNARGSTLPLGLFLILISGFPVLAGEANPSRTTISSPSKASRSPSIYQLNREINELKKQIDQMSGRLNDLQQTNETLRTQIQRLQTQVEQISEDTSTPGGSSRAGTLKWKQRIAPEGSRHGALSVSPAIHPNGTILVSGRGETRSLYAFGPDGREKWRHNRVHGEATVGPDGMIYVRSLREGDIAAINPRSGEVTWETLATSGGSRVSVGPEGSLYTQNSNGRVFKFSADDGTLNWRFDSPIDGERFGDGISIDREGTLYLTGHSLRGEGHRQLYALRSDGRVKWTYRYRGESRSMPAIGANGTVYVVINFGGGLRNTNGTLVAFNQDGDVKWQFETGDKVTHMNDATFRSHSHPVIGQDGTIYVGSSNGNLYAINPDGSLRWKYDAGSAVKSTPAVGRNGTIYVGTVNGTLLALNNDGSTQWRYESGGRIQGSVNIGSDGTVYFTSWDGFIHAIHSDSGGLADSPWPRYRGHSRQSGHR